MKTRGLVSKIGRVRNEIELNIYRLEHKRITKTEKKYIILSLKKSRVLLNKIQDDLKPKIIKQKIVFEEK